MNRFMEKQKETIAESRKQVALLLPIGWKVPFGFQDLVLLWSTTPLQTLGLHELMHAWAVKAARVGHNMDSHVMSHDYVTRSY